MWIQQLDSVCLFRTKTTLDFETHSSILWGFPDNSAGKESACNAGDMGSIPGVGRSRGEGQGYPLQYSGLENSMDCIVHGVTRSQTRLSGFHVHLEAQEGGLWQEPQHQEWRLGDYSADGTQRPWMPWSSSGL